MYLKKRKYYENYVQYGFTSININGKEKPQCVICNKVLSHDSMKPTILKQHLENVDTQRKGKNKSFFGRNMNMLKK